MGARFDSRAGTYDTSAAHRWQADVAARFAHAAPDERVLDVATGTGLFLRGVPTPSPAGTRIGVDISAGLLGVARAQLPSAQWIRADAAHLPVTTGSMDLIGCVAGISYLDPAAVLPEWRRVLRPGGRLVVSLPADRGMTAFALLQDAATAAGVTLAEPNAGLGTRSRLERIGREQNLVLGEVIDVTYEETLTADPARVLRHYLDHGFAEPLRRADLSTQQRALAAYRKSYGAAAEAGLGSQRLLFACWTTPHH